MHPPTTPTARAGNGTRTRDPNLGKVVLYQLSYSRRPRLPSRTATPLRTCSEPASPLLQPRYGKVRGDGGEGNRTPDLLNAIQALSQLSYAPGDGRVRREGGRPSGTAKYSRVYIRCQRNGTSENVYGQYFAAPSRVVADLRWPPQKSLAISRLLTIEMRRNSHTLVAAHRCVPRLRRKREAKHQ